MWHIGPMGQVPFLLSSVVHYKYILLMWLTIININLHYQTSLSGKNYIQCIYNVVIEDKWLNNFEHFKELQSIPVYDKDLISASYKTF